MGFFRQKPFNKKVPVDDSIEIKNEKPPIYKSVRKFLGVKEINAFFTYGEVIYNPAELPVPGDIIVHEKVHMRQQKVEGMTPAIWWGKWLRDEKFRIDQEARGYAAQLVAVRKVLKDKNAQARVLHSFAMSLSGPLYKNVIGHSEAMMLIRSYAK